MKKTILSIALSSVLATTAMVSTSANAAIEGLSANVGLTSNYLWRGVSQTDDAAAVSGGIDYAHDSGFYVGTWASNVDFGDDASYELDFYAGFGNDIGDTGFAYDVGYIYYAYPDSNEVDSDNEYDFSEVYATISYDAFSITYNTLADSDWSSDFGDDTYVSADAEFEISEGLTLAVHAGNYDYDAGGDYSDYSVSLSKDGFTFAFSDTDKDNDDVVATISYAIDIDL